MSTTESLAKETITFDTWKARWRQFELTPTERQSLGNLALTELRLSSGLCYGRVGIQGKNGAATLGYFHVDTENRYRTAMRVQVGDDQPQPQGAVFSMVPGFFEATPGMSLDLNYYDPNVGRTATFKLSNVQDLYIDPYKVGEQPNLRMEGWRPDLATIGVENDDQLARYLDQVLLAAPTLSAS